MKKKICKKLRLKAKTEHLSYRKLKKAWKESFRKKPEPKFKISKRQQRKAA